MTATVTIEELAVARADGAAVIDVREPGEYVGGHVPGARLVPRASSLRALPSSTPPDPSTSSARAATAAAP